LLRVAQSSETAVRSIPNMLVVISGARMSGMHLTLFNKASLGAVMTLAICAGSGKP